MSMRLVVSAISALLVYLSALLYQCASVSLVWPPDGPAFWTCSTNDTGTVSGQLSAVGVLLAALLILALAWVPLLIRRWSNKDRVVSSLDQNLQRLEAVALRPPTEGDVQSTNDSPDITVPTTITHLQGRIDVLEEDLQAGALSPREATQDWIALLEDCNRAQNDANIHFGDLHTRLLDLFTASTSEPSPRTQNRSRMRPT